MEKKRIMELRGRAQSLKPTVHVGKDGITDTIAAELKAQLIKTKLVKLKVLPSVDADLKMVAEQLARSSDSVLIEVRGRTVVLAKD